jgi:cyclopropane fatty-acyl-phospholipid synthase-like methyltransferase
MMEFLAVMNSFMNQFYSWWIEKFFSDEYGMANVSSDETVLHIGCGVLPTMSILVAKNAHAKVIAIDNDATAVQYARRYINQQRLNESITVNKEMGRSTRPVHLT